MKIEIDKGSGFCFGVTRAINLAEQKLSNGGQLSCLGDIVHNGCECRRLANMGMKTITHSELATMKGGEVLLRAHGEPPSTYETARRAGINIVDATCPVVLRLQQRVERSYLDHPDAQIVIFGKRGHAEVLGLIGRTGGHGVVIENMDDAAQLDFTRPIHLYSQTTRPLSEYRKIVEYIQAHLVPPATLEWHDTICRQVAGRLPEVQDFAARHDVILFVCGSKSSNGHMLYNAVHATNPRSYCIEDADDICPEWLRGAESVGICGATSTPKWLMEACAKAVDKLCR